MFKRASLVALALGVTLTGCDALVGQIGADRIKQVQDQIDKQQQAQQPGATQPAAPAQPTAGTANFTVGEKWVYTITVKSMAGTMTGEVTNTVTKIDGDTATFTSATALSGNAPITATKTVKLTDPDPYKGLVMDESMKTDTPVFTDESVTVPAGTFAARKAAYKGTKDGAEMTVNAWATKDLGVIKYDIVTKPTAAALPAGLPAGFGNVIGGLDLSSTTTVELKSHTK